MGPLDGIRVVEMAGLGPAPFCAMLLADLGAEVIRVDRPPSDSGLPSLDQVTCRGRRSIRLDLKRLEAVEILLNLVDTADVLIEGLRPGVAERLGFGPHVCRERNARLVYGRMTGWGQEGPLSERAGHDINYIAITGALDAVGATGGAPIPPLNLIGDFGGGALYMAMGVLSALVERGRSGEGQVVDAAMVDGAASLMTMFYEWKAAGMWDGGRGTNLLDGGAPFYDTYETADGGYVAVGALEPQFYDELVQRLELDKSILPAQYDKASWPELRRRIAAAFALRSRDEWSEVFADTDACVVPVLSMVEAPNHPHNIERGTFANISGVVQPAPAPRFSRSVLNTPEPVQSPGQDTDALLEELGLAGQRIAGLRAAGVVF
ncbi:MAG: CaiB/BaiF CoA-transferase family protein [Actinomycetota bacterium]|nr:CaiB/BaiF CoA-transferase family protein [Actinomycetota bacterium]